MTVEDVIKFGDANNLNEQERYKFRQIAQKYPLLNMADTSLSRLFEQICRTLGEGHKVIWKPLILTLPMNEYNAATSPLSERYVLFIFDDRVMDLCGVISKSLAKHLPPGGPDIAPSSSAEEAGNSRIDIKRMESLIDADDYREFKKAFLYFNGIFDGFSSGHREQDKIVEQIRDAFSLFLMGHEIAHALLGHSPGQDGKRRIDKVLKQWDMELDADFKGYELMRDTMARIHPDVKYKAQFNLGFELFCQCLAINELLSLLFEEREFTEGHPDADGSRLRHLRRKVTEHISFENNEEPLTVEWYERVFENISSRYMIDISNTFFDCHERKLTEEILFLALTLDEQRLDNKNFRAKLRERLGNFTALPHDAAAPGFNEWKTGNFTQALGKFAKGGYRNNFQRILAVLYCHEYEKYYSRMLSCIGPGEGFAEGVIGLLNFDLALAEVNFTKTLKHEPDDPLAAFALGFTYSVMGEVCFANRDYKNAARFFTGDIEKSPAARPGSFAGRRDALRRSGHRNDAREDNAIVKILSRAPSARERAQEWINKML
jgi:hypothetical protein